MNATIGEPEGVFFGGGGGVGGIGPADTIVAPASGPGRSRRAMIRLSGPSVRALLNRHLVPPPSMPRTIVRADLRMGNSPAALALPCLVMRSDAPASFTGEDSAELLIPGNPALVDRIVSRFVAHDGVRLARPGEFSARAYLAGKLTLEHAEGIAATIAAQTDAQLLAAGRLLDGSRGREYRAWAEEVATLLALVEAGIDFSDQEDVVPIAPDDLRRRCGAMRAAIASRLGASAAGEHRAGLARVVLVGAPNAGKSTLFNALLARPRALVSDVAGTTRDALIEQLDLSPDAPGSDPVLLIDLAGLDPGAPDEIDRAAQAEALSQVRRADVVIHCDHSGRFDRNVLSGGVRSAPRPVIRVQTKADIAPAAEVALRVCALDGWNLAPLRRAIADAAHSVPAEDPEATLLPRHRRALALTLAALDATLDAMPRPGTRALPAPEIIAAGLRAALDQLGDITGAVSPDDVLGRVFAVFCIGK